MSSFGILSHRRRGVVHTGNIVRIVISVHGIEDNLTILFNCSLDFDQVAERAFGQPNILPVGG
jgi:hypothetical protein